MNYLHRISVLGFVNIFLLIISAEDIEFDTNYVVTYGNDHAFFLNQRREVKLSLDKNNGGGFGSKLHYGSGFFEMKMKLHDKDSAGVITPFYLISDGNHQDEIDFEFLGNTAGKPLTLQTNVYVNGEGGREQRIYLWFDPKADFHTYTILWNQHQVVWYVDNIPIRVFKNNTRDGEVSYPTKGMRAMCSIWHGDWASSTNINWSHAPFTAHFQGFGINGCPNYNQDCFTSNKYWWNQNKYWSLDRNQQKLYENVRNKYMYYDYCTDRSKHPTTYPECALNS